MSGFDVARIVPSTRDLLSGLATRRRSLAIVPLVSGASETLFDARAFAATGANATMAASATATRDVPLLCLDVCRSVSDCQRARFFGADGVCFEPGDEASFAGLSNTARSMRMMALAFARDPAQAAASSAFGARAIVVRGGGDLAVAVSAALAKQTVLVIDWSLRTPSPDELRSLVGHVDAVIVPAALFMDPAFAQLSEELDR
jgi:hypothetical protein